MLDLTFALQPGGGMPLYEQLYRQLAGQIGAGQLAAGSRMPGKRSLAETLGVSVNTVDTAYQILTAEGYLESRPRSGFFVQEGLRGGWAGPCIAGARANSPSPGGAAGGAGANGPAAGSRPTNGMGANNITAGTDGPEPLPCPASFDAAPGADAPDRRDKGEVQCPSPLSETKEPSPCPRAPDESENANSAVPVQFDLSTSGVDTRLFPFRSWGRIQKELLYSSPGLLGHGHRQGDENLRAAIAGYLSGYRGVRCSPGQIVVGAGLEYLLGLLARLLAGSTAAVENPGYARTRIILGNNGIPCRPLDIDGGGLPAAALTASGAKIAYVTPSHQFPTGVTMPAGRRAELLAWARAEPGRYILEDDYDSEFRYDIRPLPSLQGMAGPDGPVVYLTTFSKSLAPSIRIACMVLPRPLLERYRAMYGVYSSTVSRFEQQTLCRFMEEGYFTRHLARLRKAYRLRMEGLCAALEEAFGPGRLRLQGRHSGLHLLLGLCGESAGITEEKMVQTARAAGVRLTGLSSYYMARPGLCPPRTVVVGYAGLPPEQLVPLAQTLARAWTPTP